MESVKSTPQKLLQQTVAGLLVFHAVVLRSRKCGCIVNFIFKKLTARRGAADTNQSYFLFWRVKVRILNERPAILTEILRFSGVKDPRRAAEHSPPFGAEVKNMWSYTSTTPYASIPCLLNAGKILPL